MYTGKANTKDMNRNRGLRKKIKPINKIKDMNKKNGYKQQKGIEQNRDIKLIN